MYENLTPEQMKQLNELLSMSTLGSQGTIDGQYNPQMDAMMNGPAPTPFSRQDLAGLQAGNTDPGVMFASGQGAPVPTPPPAPEAPPLPTNYVQRGSDGLTTDLDSAAVRRPNVWADGSREVRREQNPDGTFTVWKKMPSYDGDGRQTTVTVKETQIPDYLNPAKLKELEYRKKVQDLEGGGRGAAWTKFESGGQLYRLNTKTGDIQPIVASGQQLEGPGMQKIKKDQAGASATKAYADSSAQMIETSLADILGVKPEELGAVLDERNTGRATSRVAPAVGVIDAKVPTLLPNTRNIESAIENLKSKAQMFGLTNLRKSGVAPGSITEREWPKFESTLGNIDPSLSEEAFVKQLRDIYRQSRAAKDSGMLDYQSLGGSGAEVQGQLLRDAEAAIAAGADRTAVMQRLQQHLGGN